MKEIKEGQRQTGDAVEGIFRQLFPKGEDLLWREKALCARSDPEAFFPEKGGSLREAKPICASCEVVERCLMWALKHDERFGIWGGLSERERRHFKKTVSAKKS